MRGKSFSLLLLLVTMLLALGLAACGGDDDDGGEAADTGAADTDGGDGGGGGTLVFAGAADPVVLDGALVSDGESLRVIDQIYESLVSLEPGTTELAPGLAQSWELSDDGLEYTFELQEGVTFHDGEPFNAEAVCFNFDRWYNFTGSFQNPSASYYWQTVFGGFAETDPDSGAPEESYFESCEAVDEGTVIIRLTSPSSAILGALSLSNFSIASPAALEEFGADEGEVDDEGIFHPTGTFGTEHPIGTGPFKFVSWTRGDRLVLERNEDYWGEPASIDELIFRPIADNAARLQALQSGEIQGYDLVEPQDVPTIEGDENLQILDRPAFNVGYVGINQAHAPLDQLEVRQAIAAALNRQEVVDSFYAGRGVVAKEFMPPEVIGYADDVTEYEYDPATAEQLLQDAGVETPLEITFCYPTDVSRPYMPDPQRNFEAFAASLNEAGFAIKPRSAPWSPDYLGLVDEGKCPLYLLGWTGDFGDPDNFIGTFFQTAQKAWGFENQEIFDILNEAEAETDLEAREGLYQEANRLIMDFLPGVPYVHTEPALAFAANIQGYVPSPVSLESFASVTIEE
ncbi:MAG TPA: ABC transporter substrate-binding protein [Gaiellaceae bacterium]|nr:ABC transporter substrate-binding protein [Gaiellaceae bacterium]